MLIAGPLFFLFPIQLLELMGASLGEPGAVMTRLFGLLLVGMGWSMALSPNAVPFGSAALMYVICAIIAMAILISAATKGMFGVLAIALAIIYLLSSINFLYCYLQEKRISVESSFRNNLQ